MTPLNLQTPCPCCQQALEVAALQCPRCQIKVEGKVSTNEFANLPPEELHLLRVFVWAEGRIKEMEGPLGLSYPTIRSRLTALREKLRMENKPPERKESVSSTLDALDSGAIDFESALELLKKRKKGKS
jgi:hypothetical protein